MNRSSILLYVLASISFVVVIGGAVYEHLAVVPVWASAVPASLTMFQGDYRLAAQNFWIPIHPVTLGLFAAATAFNWRTERRLNLLIPFAGYIAILLITFIYFVPELIALTGAPYAAVADAELTRRARTWETLSLVRLTALLGLAVVLLYGLSKGPTSDLKRLG